MARQDPWANVPIVRERAVRQNQAPQDRVVRTDSRVSYTQENPEELRAQGYEQQPDGRWLKVTRQQLPWESVPVVEAPTESQVRAGQIAQDRLQRGDGLRSGGGAFVQGGALGFADEAAGLAAGGGQLVGNAFRRLTGQPIEVNSADLRSAMTGAVRTEQDRFAREQPVANVAAQVAGGLLTGGIGGGGRATIGNAARIGTGYGVAYGTGTAEGNIIDRLPSAAIGGATGAVGGAAIQGGMNAARPVIGGIAQRLGAIGRPRPTQTQATTMAGRVTDFDRVGVDPVLAGVGGPVSQRTGQIMAGNIVTEAPLRRASIRAGEQTEAAVDRIAGQYGVADGRDAAGRTLRNATEASATRLRQEGGQLYEPINALEQNTAPIRLDNAARSVQESLDVFQTPAVRDWFTRNASDLTQFQDVLQRADNQVTFAEARNLRSIVGKMMADPQVFNSRSEAGLRSLYGALSDDITAGARQLGGDEAASALSRADTFYSAARSRADGLLKNFYQARNGREVTDAEAYNQLLSAARTKGNRSSSNVVRQLRESVTPQEWGDIGGGIIRTLGDDGRGNFSVARFASEFEGLTPEARRIMFGGRGREQEFADLNALARVARQQQQAGRFYNFSESGNALGNIAGLGAGGAALSTALSGNPVPLVVLVGGALASRGLAELLTSPGVARWMAGSSRNAVRSAEQLARRNADFGRWWATNRTAVTQAVNDNVSLPAVAAAQEDEPIQ